MFSCNYVTVTDISGNEFLGAIALYEQSFPLSEKLSCNVIKNKIETRIFQLWIKKDQEKVILMAILSPLPQTNFTLLGYLATSPEYRGQGLGKDFMIFIQEQLQKHNQWLLLEVENPLFPPDKELKQRRVNFYLRLGAKIIKDVPYLLPKLSKQKSPEMILMVYPDYQTYEIDNLLIEQLITLVYQYFYDQPNHKNIYFLVKKIPQIIELSDTF
ncbi:GNAT family N-acetyltransferase [Cyanobacterium stanieri LEGE 03274]|uniref:GNAT family N-acetyltransferase n=1 Tax=Cyanobacterium stanieri LEGE 03274 TaxID=1828756 RepID=A0ABR9V2V6_9CHRO|nr:GNAT family N-acetyltransferase [Cyanobacterium stanieri]MBE9222215.1 GNAT family N-acetyltransferase [Cyanobacterium stanieri LEGE 03274]